MLFEDCSGGNGQYRLEERGCQQREQFRRCPNHLVEGRRKIRNQKEVDIDWGEGVGESIHFSWKGPDK